MSETTLRFTATPAEIAAKRDNLMNGIATREAWERANAPADDKGQRELESICDYLGRMKGRAEKLQETSLAFAVRNGIDFIAEYNHKRVEGARRNVYSMPKDWEIMSALNTGRFAGNSSDCNTIAATIVAVAAGHVGGKKMWDHINTTCSALGMGGGRYGSGATQGGSTLRSLSGLGIMRRDGAGHVVYDEENFKLLLKAARAHIKKYASA